jgi:hypothetical protein
LNLHRIGATYAVGNERSGRLLRRLGFVTEGTLRQLHYTGQAWLDEVVTSLLNAHRLGRTAGRPDGLGVARLRAHQDCQLRGKAASTTAAAQKPYVSSLSTGHGNALARQRPSKQACPARAAVPSRHESPLVSTSVPFGFIEANAPDTFSRET